MRGTFLTLRTKIVLLVVSLFFLSLFIVGIVVEHSVVDSFEARLGDNAMNIARTVAAIPEIARNIGSPDGVRIIQPLADGIRKRTGTEFIVVIDTLSIRYSHPVPERIGRKLVGGDEGPALSGREYISRATGTLGPSLRAFVPVYLGERQVGAVLVGILLDDVNAMKWRLSRNLLVALLLGLAVGLIGAALLARNVKRSIRGLEPEEIGRILKEREAMLESVREGILAVDDAGNVTLMNGAARRLLELKENVEGHPVVECVPNSRLPEVLRTGEAEFDQEQDILNARILTNRLPIVVRGRIVGAIASFRDMTEIKAMAEELTGVRRYVEALRVRNHEFLNKLQTISGLIQLGESSQAIDYISETVQAQQTMMSFITRRIKNSSVGGLLLGKMGRCRELGIDFHIDPDCYLGPQQNVDSNALVVIIGNLLENAMRALLTVERSRRRLNFSIFDESGRILISVGDTGPGIAEKDLEHIFDRGFTTRPEGGGGYGLYNVKCLVDAYNGEINVSSFPDSHTEFVINLPNGGDLP